jgi:uncharacterized repeat protein (TIGR01451 family)
MKKLIYLIVLALILGLVLTGCLLSNVGQVPANEQSGISYLTKGVGSMTVVSSTSTPITGVYNKAGGVSNFVDLSTPILAVRAWEPDSYPDNYPTEPPEAIDSTWDNGVNWFEDNLSSADWIWETHLANGPTEYGIADPLYDADASISGRVVLFETTFEIPGDPTSATLRIAADNGWEAWVNAGTHHLSSTVIAGWETSNLHEAYLKTSGWQSYGTINIASELVSGTNTLYVLAGNEYFAADDGNTPTPASKYNPGAAIFQLDINYETEAPAISVVKTGPDYAHEGDTIGYTYEVSNTGNVPLSAVAVTDTLGIAVSYVSGDTNLDTMLDIDETWIFTASYEIPIDTTGPVENTATASGTSPHLTIVTVQDNWSVVVLHPAISVTKVADTAQYYIDGSVTYTIVVTNTGDCTLYDISVVDDVLGTLVTGLTLDSGESATYHPVSYPVENVTITNTVTATGYDALDGEVTDTATETILIERGFTLTWGYWKTHSSYGPAPYNDTWALLGVDGVDTDFFISNQTYYEVLWTSVAGGNAYYKLAHQYIGAELNVLNGAWMRADVQAAFDEATGLLNDYTPAEVMSFKKGTTAQKAIFAQFNSLAGILDAYNNGLMGTPHAP